jgi:outer membrane translocation and assembly module TamA
LGLITRKRALHIQLPHQVAKAVAKVLARALRRVVAKVHQLLANQALPVPKVVHHQEHQVLHPRHLLVVTIAQVMVEAVIQVIHQVVEVMVVTVVPVAIGVVPIFTPPVVIAAL